MKEQNLKSAFQATIRSFWVTNGNMVLFYKTVPTLFYSVQNIYIVGGYVQKIVRQNLQLYENK